MNPRDLTPHYVSFWREYHLCTLTTLRADGSPHVVPVGATLDPEAALARVTTNRHSAKARHIAAAGPGGARVALCQVHRARWATLEGRAVIRTEPEMVEDALRRYAERYERTPASNPDRVLIEIAVERALGHVPPPADA